jgi:hypothetical protein
LSRISVYGLAPPCLFWAGNKLLLTLLNASKSSCALLLRGSNPTPAVLLFFFSLVCFLVLPACTASPRLAGHQIPRVQPPLPWKNRTTAGQQQASPRRVEKARLILPPPAGPWHDKNAAKWRAKNGTGSPLSVYTDTKELSVVWWQGIGVVRKLGE